MLRPLLRSAALIALAMLPLSAAHASDATLPDSVRIRVLGRLSPQEIEVRAPAGGLLVHSMAGPRAVLPVSAGERLVVRTERGEIRAEAGGRVAQGPSLGLSSVDGGVITLRTGSESRSYRGTIAFSPDAERPSVLQIVNHVDLEDYVAAVVAVEYGLDDLEGTKAMAVVARTYAVRGAGIPGTAWDHEDDEGSQVYRGSGSVTQVARIAAEDTRGEVLTWRGEPIEAVYSSSSGGHTASNEDVWNSAPFPYLRGREDPWDRTAPHHEWSWSVDRDRLHRMIQERFDVEPRSLDVGERSGDGRAAEVRIDARRGEDRSIPSGTFRSAVVGAFGGESLRSTFFEIRRSGDRYVFEGRGYGHGVGLNQWGAHGMAGAGKSYREILAFYYTDVRLERGEATDVPWTLAAVASERAPVDAAAGMTAPTASDGTPKPEAAEALQAREAAAPKPDTITPPRARDPLQAWGSREENHRPDSTKNRTVRRRVGW
jgi:stage II sporulation protein D